MPDTLNPVLAESLRPGDTLIADGGFTCLAAGAELTVDAVGDEFYVPCACGHHYLNGATDHHGFLVGLTRRAA